MLGYYRTVRFIHQRVQVLSIMSNKNWKPLFKAVDAGQLETLQSKFTSEDLVHARDAESCTALHRAARNGQSEVCRYLIEQLNFDVNETATRAKTPLYEATAHGHLDCAETLIQLGANIEKSKYNEWNPLHVASSKGYSRLVKLLLDQVSEGAIDAKNKEGSTALSLACREGHAETASMLIKAGANVNTKNHNGRVPLLSACASGSLETVQALIELGKCSLLNADVTDKSGATPLHEAATCEEGQQVIEWLLTSPQVALLAQPWLEAGDQAGRLPTHIAALNGNAKCFRSLLWHAKHAERLLNSRDNSGATALFLASVRGHALVAMFALQFGADPYATDTTVRTCIEVAAAWKHQDVVAVLERRVFLTRDCTPIRGLGFGTYKLGEQTYPAVLFALKSGLYRCIDMAEFYGNEAEVGRAIESSQVERGELFLISKIWNNNVSSGNARNALQAILRRLKTSYLDAILVHWPCKGYDSAFEDLLKCRQEGLVRYVGVSNFLPEHLETIYERCGEYPALNQIEMSVFYHRPQLVQYCLRRGILVQAYRSLGCEGFVGKSVASSNSIGALAHLDRIAENHHKTRSQILLRWCLQHNVMVIPKSTHEERIKENADLFGFALSKEEMQKMDGFSIPDMEEQWMKTVFNPSSIKDVNTD